MIKFNQHHVTDGHNKARVWYSIDSQNPTVRVYPKDFDAGDALGRMIPDAYTNGTDLQSDYFDKGTVTLSDGHPLYAAARTAAETANTASDVRRAARVERARNPQPADPSTVVIKTDTTSEHGRTFEILSGGLPIIVSMPRPRPGLRTYCHVMVRNATARAYRGNGKIFASIEKARAAYRDARVLAALVAVENAINAPASAQAVV